MKLPKAFRQDSPDLGLSFGFTILEVLISLAILVFLISIGLFLSMDFFRTFSFHSDESIVISILHKSRARALSNINQSDHGVHYDRLNHELIMFEGSSYDPADSKNEIIPLNKRLVITWADDVVFHQISGNSSDETVTVVDGAKTLTITINELGRIEY